MEDKNEQAKPNNYWNNIQTQEIIKTLTVLIEGQKNYGKDYSVKATFDYFKMKLNGRFSAEQVLYAIDKYTDLKNDIPAPADLIAILNPIKPRVTEAQFVQAQKWQAANGYPIFSDAKDVIEEYHQQDAQEREQFVSQSNEIKALVSGSVKRITDG